MRGKLTAPVETFIGLRITPACAGKTHFLISCNCRRADHPRVCGENERALRDSSSLSGSPPRVRGKQRERGSEQAGGGITSAYAGKTWFVKWMWGKCRDYPAYAKKTVTAPQAKREK